MKKNLCFLFALLFSGVLQVFAYSITVIIVQNDVTQPDVRLTTRVVEDALLDSFFDGGSIVSTEPIVSEAGNAEQIRREISSAAAGGFDFILSLTVQYKNRQSANPKGLVIADIHSFQWEVFRASDIKRLASGNLEPSAAMLTAAGERESRQMLKKICEQLRKDINTAIAESGRSR